MTNDPRSMWERIVDEQYQSLEEDGVFDIYDRAMSDLEKEAELDPDVRAAMEDCDEDLETQTTPPKRYR